MRIVSGKYRHRKLLTSPGLTTRPITDRVKVALFDRLRLLLEGARVADLFAGAGTIGLEALSRGASRVVFVEQDRRAFELLKQNVALLKAEEETLCWRTDAFRSSFRPKGVEGFLPYDLIFFDPPYKLVPEIVPGKPLYQALERLAAPGVAAPDALLILRCDFRTEFTLPPAWEPDEKFQIGKMALHFFRVRAGTASDSSNPESELTEDRPAAEAAGDDPGQADDSGDELGTPS